MKITTHMRHKRKMKTKARAYCNFRTPLDLVKNISNTHFFKLKQCKMVGFMYLSIFIFIHIYYTQSKIIA